MSIGLCRVWATSEQGKEWIQRPNFTLHSPRLIDNSHTSLHASFVRLFSHHRIFFPFLVLSSIFFVIPDIFHPHQPTIDNHPSLSLSPSIVMTSSSPTPDIASLSLSSQPPHQRLHDTYDFEGPGTGNVRTQYHFATSPPVQPSHSPFHPLSMNQSPLKTKTSRAGLPSVRSLFFFSH